MVASHGSSRNIQQPYPRRLIAIDFIVLNESFIYIGKKKPAILLLETVLYLTTTLSIFDSLMPPNRFP